MYGDISSCYKHNQKNEIQPTSMFYINIKSSLIVDLYQTRENSIKPIIKLPLYFCCLFYGIIIIVRSSCRYSFNSKHTYNGSGAHSKVNIITNIGKLHVWSFLICQFTHAKKTRPTVIESFTRLPLLFIVALPIVCAYN